MVVYNKYIFALLVLFISFSAFGQQYTPMTAAGYQMKRIKADSTLHIPSFCGVPSILNSTAKQGALAMDTCNNLLYMWTRANGWDTVNVSGGGGNQDLQSVLNNGSFAYNKDINLYGRSSANQIYLSGMDNSYMPFMALGDSIGGGLYSYTYPQATIEFQNKYQSQKLKQQDSIRATIYLPTQAQDATDTLATLANVRSSSSTFDSTSLSNRINTKLNLSDSTIYQTKFRSDTARTNTYTAIDSKLNKSDTANAFLISVSQPNDSSLTFVKGTTSTNYIIRASTSGSATRLVTTVYNNTGTTIPKGSVVYISGRHSSNLPTIALAVGNNEENSYKTFALVESDIPTSNSGIVIQAGNIGNLNIPTSSFTDGDIIYLSPTVPGGITIVKPLAPFHICKIGSITRAHPTFGSIEVKIENGWQMDEMSDVQIPLYPNDSTLLQYSRVDSLWHAVSIPNAIGSNYLKPSDSTIFQTKFRSDTARTNTYSAIASKIGTSDTSVFQRKSIAAYSFMANNTASSANATSFTFREQASQTLSSGITWNGTPPSGTTNHQYRWCQIGNLVTFYATLLYGTVGVNNTQLTLVLPSDLPTPFSPTGLTSANNMLYYGAASIMASNTTIITASRQCMLRRNTANTGFEIIVTQSGAVGVTYASITIQYFTN